jgi:hypothetical protein
MARPPQLDINGMALSVHSIEKTGAKSIPMRLEQRRRSFEVGSFRARHPELVARREQEVRLLERHLGRIPVSELLPNSEPELADYRPELIRRIDKLPEVTFHALSELVGRHRDPADSFTFADFDFIHAPGGHAPMVDFRDNPWLGETLHLARENDVTISLICHAPIGVTSTGSVSTPRPRLRGQRQPVPRRPHLDRSHHRRTFRPAVPLSPRPGKGHPTHVLRRRSH